MLNEKWEWPWLVNHLINNILYYNNSNLHLFSSLRTGYSHLLMQRFRYVNVTQLVYRYLVNHTYSLWTMHKMVFTLHQWLDGEEWSAEQESKLLNNILIQERLCIIIWTSNTVAYWYRNRSDYDIILWSRIVDVPTTVTMVESTNKSIKNSIWVKHD